MVMQEELEDLYGPLAAHSEHKVGDHITYHLAGEPGKYSGVFLWGSGQKENDVEPKGCKKNEVFRIAGRKGVNVSTPSRTVFTFGCAHS